jgi:hypothetical protein
LRNGKNLFFLLRRLKRGAACAPHFARLLVIYPVLFSGKIATAE